MFFLLMVRRMFQLVLRVSHLQYGILREHLLIVLFRHGRMSVAGFLMMCIVVRNLALFLVLSMGRRIGGG